MRLALRTSFAAVLFLAVMAGIGAPAQAEVPVQVTKDIAYAPAEPPTSRGHLLDLYLPEGRGKPRPLVIWTSGSAWLSDNGKAGAEAAAAHFNQAGYAVAGVSVRSSTQAQFPAQLHDIKAAIRWLRVHAKTYGIDPHRFAIMGNSSGGWVTSMAALTGDVPWLEGDVGVRGASSAVQAAVNFYGPTNFREMDAHMLPGACDFFNQIVGTTDCHNDVASPESRLVGCAIQTCPGKVKAANPATYATPNDPPMMILHGQDDMLVPTNQSELLYDTIKRRCGRATFYSIPGVGHEHPYVTDPARANGHTVRSTAWCGREQVMVDTPEPTWSTIEAFIARTLR